MTKGSFYVRWKNKLWWYWNVEQVTEYSQKKWIWVIAVLEVIGVNVSDDVKNYVMDEHLDWIKLKKHLDEDCVLPMNVFRQMIEKLQNQEQNS